VAGWGCNDEIPGTFTTNLPGPITQVSAPTTASTATAPSATATGTTGIGTTTGGTTTGESGPGGAGDEQGTRVPAIFSLKAGRLTPPNIGIPTFIAAQVTVTSTDARAHTVVVKVGKGYTFSVSPRGSGTTRVPGQKAGKFQVLVDGKPAGSLTWGTGPGP
jgi:hypothetical protein